MKEIEKLSKWIVSVLAIVSAISFCLATIYYFIFFIHVDTLSTQILTISDYFDKAADLIPYVFVGSFIIIWFEINSKSPGPIKSKKNRFYLYLIGVAVAFLGTLIAQFPLLAFVLLTMNIFIAYYLDHGENFINDTKNSINIPKWVIPVLFFGLINGTVFNAYGHLQSVIRNDVNYLDTISEGIIYSENKKITFEHKNGKNYTSRLVRLKPIGCTIKWDFFCKI